MNDHTETESDAPIQLSKQMLAELFALQAQDNGCAPAASIPKNTRIALIERNLIKAFSIEKKGAFVVILHPGRMAVGAAKRAGYPELDRLDILEEDLRDTKYLADSEQAFAEDPESDELKAAIERGRELGRIEHEAYEAHDVAHNGTARIESLRAWVTEHYDERTALEVFPDEDEDEVREAEGE